jgi:hypothetical protein
MVMSTELISPMKCQSARREHINLAGTISGRGNKFA